MKRDKIKKIIALKGTKEDIDQIEKLAVETERSLSGFVSYIVKNYLTNYLSNNSNEKKD